MGERVKLYWEKRIEAMSLNPELHREEAIEFIGWIKDTLIGPKETLELIEECLNSFHPNASSLSALQVALDKLPTKCRVQKERIESKMKIL